MKFPKTTSLILFIVALIFVAMHAPWLVHQEKKSEEVYWVAPDTVLIPAGPKGELIRYGRSLIANTAAFLGPNGSVAHMSNGMNCQNCHLEAGTKFWGNNYGAVNSTYPRFRERSGTIENVYKRVNDCIQRSLNGQPLDSNSREMQALMAYINWVGRYTPKKIKPVGTGIADLPFLDRAADPDQGKKLYLSKCTSCHGVDGAGQMNTFTNQYTYPPLWGDNSYNTGAGLYRISRFAGYIHDNMPFGASHANTQLTIEESWDIAAFVNSQPRPDKRFKEDWPDISKKPIDHPFGPYADGFNETQHKYGPYPPIKKARDEQAKNKNSK